MKILLINPNTSQFVTQKIAAEAARAASSGTDIVAVTGKHGASIVSGRSESALAACEAMSLAVEHSSGCDAVVLGISFDSGLRALRELLAIPVVGMTEAAMLTACTLGGKFSMVTFGDRGAPIYSELCHSYGLSSRLAGVIALPVLTQSEMRDPASLVPLLTAAVDETIAKYQAEAAILVGAIFAGLSDAVAKQVSIPVLNGIAEAVGLAEMLARLKPQKARSGSYQHPAKKDLTWPTSGLPKYFQAL